MYQRGGGDGAGEVRDDTDKVRLADRGNLHHFGDAAHVWQGGAHVVDVVILHQRVEIPAVAPFFASGDGNFDQLPQARKVFAKGFRAHGILDEEGRQRLDEIAAANGVRQVESLMKINAPIAVFSHAFARLNAFVVKLIQLLVGIEGGF